MKNTGEPFTYLFRKMWHFSAGNRMRAIVFLAFSAIANMILLLEPMVFGFLLNEVQNNGVSAENFSTILLIASSLIVITVAFWIFHGTSRVMERKNAFRVRKQYKEYLLTNVLSLKLAWHGDRDSGDTIDKVEKGTKALYSFSSEVFVFVEIIVRLVGTAIILLAFNFYSAFALFVIVVIAYAVIHLFDRRLIGQFSRLNTMENTITAKIFDGLSNITSVIILRIQPSVMKGIQASIDAPYQLYMKNSVLNEWKWFCSSLLFEAAIIVPLILFVYASLGPGSVVEVGTITAMYLYLRNTGNVFFSFAYHYEELLKHRASVFNAENLEADFKTAEERKVNRSVKKEVAVTNLTFSYEGEEDMTEARHLDDVSVSFKAGERVALVGESGSGKTTFLKVLHGLYEVKNATVTVDGKQLRKPLNQVDLGTTLVPQEPELFSASIEENITLGVTTSAEKLDEVIRLAEFQKVVADLPNGLQSKINEKGVNLSGGQKQRLALARALLFAADKEIVLLDESTSSVDPVTERRVYQNIFKHFKRQTILASIHKFNLLDQFDRVLLFENGTLIGDGPVATLKKNNDTFKRMWDEYSESIR